MHTEDTPDRRPEAPQNHHFEMPVVREARSDRATHEERDDGADAAAEPRRPQEREMAFQQRWEKMQTAFVARGRRGLRPA